MDNDETFQSDSSELDLRPVHWRPLHRFERRVLGVMVEKSKTTPDIYPMTVNAITTACNQKNNRKPQMQLSSEDVTHTLSDLRETGVVVEIHGDGRAVKFKHQLYEWLGVDRVELAIMAELFLRGEQTLGDLRGRTSRMEKIADLASLKPVFAGLLEKNLVIALTPPGRGQLVTHNLYLPDQLTKLHRQYGEITPKPSDAQQSLALSQQESVRQESVRLSDASEVPVVLSEEGLSEEDSQNRLCRLEKEFEALKARVVHLEKLLE